MRNFCDMFPRRDRRELHVAGSRRIACAASERDYCLSMVCEVWAVPCFLLCRGQGCCVWRAVSTESRNFPAKRGSHAGDYAAAVFDDDEVGIDMERTRRVNVNVMRRQFTAAENAYLRSKPDAFLRLWTRKESYCKAVGEGLHLPLSSFDVLEDQVTGAKVPDIKTADAKEFYLYTEVPAEEYVLSVCAGHPVGGCLVEEVDLRKLFDGIS